MLKQCIKINGCGLRVTAVINGSLILLWNDNLNDNSKIYSQRKGQNQGFSRTCKPTFRCFFLYEKYCIIKPYAYHTKATGVVIHFWATFDKLGKLISSILFLWSNRKNHTVCLNIYFESPYPNGHEQHAIGCKKYCILTYLGIYSFQLFERKEGSECW